MLRLRIWHHDNLGKQVRPLKLEALEGKQVLGFSNIVMHCFLILKAPYSESRDS